MEVIVEVDTNKELHLSNQEKQYFHSTGAKSFPQHDFKTKDEEEQSGRDYQANEEETRRIWTSNKCKLAWTSKYQM